MWFSTGSGRIELNITLTNARIGHHQGQCDDDVRFLSKLPSIKRQLDAIDREVLAAELKEYGAWDAQDLRDHEQNLQRILWIACGDICDTVVLIR